MRTGKFHICLSISLILIRAAAGPDASGQSRSYSDIASLPEAFNESHLLIADRNLYAVGEKIYFSAFNTSPPPIKNACWSRVVYVHLIDPGGNSLVRGKFNAECHGASGYLEIPGDLLTGHYYLCACTKWMRNYHPDQYAYVPLKIINPFSPQLEDSSIPAANRKSGDSTAQPGNSTSRDPSPKTPNNFVSLNCSTGKSSYHTGEPIRLSVQYPGVWGAVKGHISVSVVRPAASDTMMRPLVVPEVSSSWKRPDPGYLPELNGPSVSGRVLSGDPPVPVNDARVELSIFGSRPRLMAYQTRSDGSFVFSIGSFPGDQDMFIAAHHEDFPELELRLDNDFAEPAVNFPVRSFVLTEPERETAREILLNMQLETLYYPTEESETTAGGDTLPTRTSIHGMEPYTVYIDDFIELPNLKEVFIELVPQVMPRTRNRTPYLSFTGNEMTREIMAQFEPLILIDQIPVHDMEKLLALPSNKIHSIEVINDIYVIGNTSYGGFINILSENGDMGGIDLPENSFFFNYRGIDEVGEDGSGTTSTGNTAMETRHDFRNCLHWEGSLPIEPEQTRTLDFRASQLPGPYRVLVRGVTEDGRFLIGTCDFEVEF